MLDSSPSFLLHDDDPLRPASPVTPESDADLLDAYSDAVARVASTVGPAVVRVETQQRAARGPRGGLGSGVILSTDGLIVTNSHVVNGARAIRVADSEGRTTDAQLLGDDPDTDL